jgi:ribosomal protein L3 glutamine methyltransferase
MPVVVEFESDIPESARAAVTRRLFVKTDPPQLGRWHWFSPRMVLYRAEKYWQPGTTISVRTALTGLPIGNRSRVRRVLDLCTGSGCLAVLAARAFPRARLDASDISAAALAVARINMQRHRMEKRIRLVRSDLFASLGDVRYDVILSNPPYVSAAAMRRLPAEYRYEPRMSLAAGHDGLDLVERILAEAPAHLAPGGVLVCEVGDGRKAVERRFAAAPLIWPRDEVFVVQASKMG